MKKLHITQCADGCWMLSLEHNDKLHRITSDHLEQDHLVQDALEMVKQGKYPGATVIIEAAWVHPSAEEAAQSFLLPTAENELPQRPAPRRARQ